ncbi:MAG: fibronectin type III domain-containing protein [Patescibacteria group bacterium]
MPKLKTKTKKKRLSVSTINLIILFLFTILLGCGLYVFYHFYLEVKTEEVQTLAESRSEFTGQKVIKELNINSLIENDYFELEEHGDMEYTDQHEIFSTNNENPVAPHKIKVINPKIGEELIIKWQMPMGGEADSAVLYRSDRSGNIGDQIAEGLDVSGFYIDTEIENNKEYFYALRSVNAEYKSEISKQVSGLATDNIPPQAPENIKAEKTGQTEIVLSWKSPTEKDFSHTRIYRSQISGLLGELIVDKVEQNTYTDTNVKDNTTYYYSITSVDKSGNESSNVLSTAPAGNELPFGEEKVEEGN